MKYKFSCVIDNKPLFKAQAFILVNSLLGGVKTVPENIYVHTLEDNLEDSFYLWLTEIGVNIVKIQPFNSENKYCNKLSQLETFTSDTIDYDYVFLLDCDTAIANLEGLQLEKDVYAKVVDFPCPPTTVLKDIFEEAELPFTESSTSFPLNGDTLTDFNNCNGGVYIFSKSYVTEFERYWKKWSNWSIEKAALFTEKYSKHADQVGFALAMAELKRSVEPLPLEYNFPSHVTKDILPDMAPKIVHFHDCIDEHLRIKKVGNPKTDAVLEQINTITFDKLSKKFDNSLFWNLRYALFPELGSGVGSRGDVLTYKQELIENITFPFISKPVLDVGCGDLELMKVLKFEQYTGLDVSQESLRISSEKRPDWNFTNNPINDESVGQADLVMCFDVLIHQSKKQDFENTVKGIVEKADKRIIIGAYNESPEYSSHITYYYNAIKDEIEKHGAFNEIGIVGRYRDITVISATKHTATHNRDIDPQDLTIAFSQVKRPDLLQYLVDISRHYFNFYTSHYPRVFEYSWLLEQLEDKSGANVLDIGAGVCPLPFALTNKGLNVTTVDYHPTVREKKDIKNWNEWGFLDYAMFEDRIESFNEDFSNFRTDKKYDYIYSISVVEHMPKKIRVGVLENAKQLLKIGGSLLLTIDLVPNTNDLWNLSEAKEVEPKKIHGSIKTLRRELKSLGFSIESEEIQRNIKDSVTDVYYIIATLREKKSRFKFFRK